MNAERRARHLAPLALGSPCLAGRAGVVGTDAARDRTRSTTRTSQSIANAARRPLRGGRREPLRRDGLGRRRGSRPRRASCTRPITGRTCCCPRASSSGIGAACCHGKLVVVEDFAIKMGAPLPPAGQAIPPTLTDRRHRTRAAPTARRHGAVTTLAAREPPRCLLAHLARPRRDAHPRRRQLGGRRRRALGRARPQRRGQDDAAAHRGALPAPDERHRRRARPAARPLRRPDPARADRVLVAGARRPPRAEHDGRRRS